MQKVISHVVIWPINEDKCLAILREVLGGGKVYCPYCQSNRISVTEGGKRFHCNACNTNFRATTQGLFHATKLPLTKWFKAIYVICSSAEPVTVRKLAVRVGVNKSTAARMKRVIDYCRIRQPAFILDVLNGIEVARREVDA